MALCYGISQHCVIVVLMIARMAAVHQFKSVICQFKLGNAPLGPMGFSSSAS